MGKYHITWLIERLLFIFLLPTLTWFIISFVPAIISGHDMHQYMRREFNILFCIALLVYSGLYGYLWITNILKDYAKDFVKAIQKFKNFFIPFISLMILIAIVIIVIENGM